MAGTQVTQSPRQPLPNRHPEPQRTVQAHAEDQQSKTNQDQRVVKRPEHQQPSHDVDHQNKASQNSGEVQSNLNSPSGSGNTTMSPTFHAANSTVTQTTYNYTYMYGTGAVGGVNANEHPESSPNANANQTTSEKASKPHNAGSSRGAKSNDTNTRDNNDYEESEDIDPDTDDRTGSKRSKTSNGSGHTPRRRFTPDDEYEEDWQPDRYNTGRVPNNQWHPSTDSRPDTSRVYHNSHSRIQREDNYYEELRPDNHMPRQVPHPNNYAPSPRPGLNRSNTTPGRPGPFSPGLDRPHNWRSNGENDNDYFHESESNDFHSHQHGFNSGMFRNQSSGFPPSPRPNHANAGFAVSTGLFNFGLQI